MGGQLQHPHHVDAHAFASLDLTGAFAMRTIVIDAALQRRPNTLPRHLDNAERGDLEDFGSGPIALDGVAHGSLDSAAVLFVAHVDEVVDDDTPQVAQAQLPGDFLGGLQVHLVSRFLGVVVGPEVAAVHVDGHQGLGLIDDDRPAVGQGNVPLLDA